MIKVPNKGFRKYFEQNDFKAKYVQIEKHRKWKLEK